MIPPGVASSWAVQWLLVCIVFPSLEEYLFRAGLLAGLDRRWPATPHRNNLASSLLFAACHVPAWGGGHAALVLPPSLLLGWMYQQRRALPACVLLHGTMNALGMLLRG